MRFAVDEQETVLQLLRRSHREQVDLNRHQNAPLYAVMEQLNSDGGKDGDVVEEILRRQIFNWLPGGKMQYECLERISMLSRTDVGLLWNCKVPERDVVQVHAIWNSAQLKAAEIEELLKVLIGLIEGLGRKDNSE
jgi:hypothetical protein